VDQDEESAFQKAGIACPGERPWLGDGANESNCREPLIGALINQTNLYFPRTISAILLPDLGERDEGVMTVRNEIEQDPSICGVARTLWNMNNRPGAIALAQSSLVRRGITRTTEEIEKGLENLFTASRVFAVAATRPEVPESDLTEFRRTEFNVIRNEVNDARRMPNLRVIPSGVPEGLGRWLVRVNLVERLRETRVFYGFDRLQQSPQPLMKMPDSAMVQLFRNPPEEPQDRWLPAVEVFGEGIYLELNERCIAEWQQTNAAWLEARLSDGFVVRLGGSSQMLPPLGAADRRWASRFLLVHSLAHILINQLVFECGYSTASLRERLYVSADAKAPMASILIYTAAGDSEGTLGGLVRLGRPGRLGPLVRRALSRASWCSADPVCSENLGGQGPRQTNLAACHACVLLPETSCETINQGLDRAMVVGVPGDRSRGMMAILLEESFDYQ
jgi:hypothetical protein